MAAKTLVLASMATFLALTFIDETGVAVTLPAIQAEFGVSASGLQWVLNAFFLALAVCVFPAGRAADRIGYRRLFQAGMAVFIAASLGCGAAWSGGALIAARAIQGVGVAMMLATYALLIGRRYRPDEQGAALGTAASIGAFFLAVGPLVGGLVAQRLDWRWIFFLNVPAGLVVIAMIARSVDADPDRMRPPQLPLRSLTAFGIGFGSLIVALMQANEWGWTDPRTLACLAAAPVSLAVFCALQRAPHTRMVDLSLFGDPVFSSANVVLLTSQVAVMCVAFWALWTQLALGMSPVTAGLALLPAGIPILFMGRIGGVWADRAGAAAPIRVGVLLLVATTLLFAATSHLRDYLLAATAMLLYGFGAPLVISPAIKLVLQSAPAERQGEAAGIFNTMRQLGASLAFGCVGAILNLYDRANTAMALAGRAELSSSVREAQDLLVKHLDQLSRLPAPIASSIRDGLASGYAAAMGPAMLAATAFALVGCICAFVGMRSRRGTAAAIAGGATNRTAA